MIDPKVIRKLHAQLNSGEDDAQLEAASHIRYSALDSAECLQAVLDLMHEACQVCQSDFASSQRQQAASASYMI